MKLYCLTIFFSCISYFSIAQTAYTNEVSLGLNSNAYIPYTGAYMVSPGTVRSSATEAIYQVSEFNTSPLGLINELSMYKRSNVNNTGTLSIFLKETTSTTVEATASTTGYMLVYKGTPPSGSTGWRSVTFNGDDFSGTDLEGAASGASEFLWEKNNLSVLMIYTHSSSSQTGIYHSGVSTDTHQSASRWVSSTSNDWQNNARTMTRPFYKAAIGLTVISPLPVELTTFTAHSVDGGGELRWATKSELNNDYYTLYHSVDGINFDVIETLSGAGSSDVEIEYVYHHRKPVRKSIEYYKLRQTDYDGQYKEFGPISIYHDLILDKVFPNPANSIITVISKFNFKVYNALGKEVSIFQLSEDSYDISHLDSGVYFISFENGNKELLVKNGKN